MRMAWLDFFRGIAALTVVAFHFQKALGIPAFTFGYLAVDLFFVLSGIVLGIRYTAAIENGMTFLEFAWHRLRRLYPMVVITAALIATMSVLYVPAGTYVHASRDGAWSVLLVAPYRNSLGTEDAFPSDIPMWSLWAELASNVLWFVALRFGRRFTAAAFAFSMLAFAALAIHRGGFDVGWQPGINVLLDALLRAVAWFGVGYYIALHKPERIVHPALLVVALTLSCVLFETRVVPEAFSSALVVLSGAALMIALMDLQPKLIFTQRICTGLGMLSFPLYLIHVPAARLAYYPIRMGMNVAVAHLLTIAIAGLLAVLLNEAIVRRLPSRLPLFTARTA